MTDRRMMTMLIALCTATFFVTSAGASMAPFLNLIAGNLGTTLPDVAHLFSIQALGFVFSFVNAAGRPSLMATLAEVPSELRSALFGLNITMASLGWLLAGSVGAWLIAVSGFAGLGAFSELVAALGCGFALFSAAKPAAARGE